MASDPICSAKGGPCCFCRKPGNFLLRHSDLHPAWYCGQTCLSARCQLEAIAPKDPFDVTPSATHITADQEQMLGGQKSIDETMVRLIAVVNHLLRVDPTASEQDLMYEFRQRAHYAIALAPATNLMPDTATLDQHSTLITKVLMVMRAQVINAGLEVAQRRAALLAWQGVYAAAVASRLLIPGDLVPPAMPAEPAPALAPPAAAAPQQFYGGVPPASAAPQQQFYGGVPPASAAPQQQFYGGVPPAAALPGLGAPVLVGVNRSLLGHIHEQIAKAIREDAKNPLSGNAKFDLLAVGELAISMMADEPARSSDAAVAIGALVRHILTSPKPEETFARFRETGKRWVLPTNPQLQEIDQANTIEGVSNYRGAIATIYQHLAFLIIAKWLEAVRTYSITISRLLLNDKEISNNSPAGNRALALGKNAPKEAEFATKQAEDAQYNWVQTIVNHIRDVRKQRGPDKVLIAIFDPKIMELLDLTLMGNRWG
jgi:hypothetical protein